MRKKIMVAILTAGAFISYNVGAGFASGNELLQVFGLWDAKGIVQGLASGFITLMFACASLFTLGYLSPVKAATENYLWIGGPVAGRFFRLVTDICVLGNLMLMYSGAGNLLYQQFGLPKIVGSVLLGGATLLVMLGRMKKIQDILGCIGVIILCYMAVFLLVTLFGGHSSSENISLIPAAVEQGKALRINLFAHFPFTLNPELAAKNHPVINGMIYSSQVIIAGFPFFTSLGKRAASRKESFGFGMLAGVAYYACVSFMVIILTFNFDAIIDSVTGEMYAFPALAVVHKLWKAGSWTYSLLIFLGIFSATTGYLWVLSDRIFTNRQTSSAKKRFIVIMTVAGILIGNKIPFSALINIMFPLTGSLGFLLIVVSVVRLARIRLKD